MQQVVRETPDFKWIDVIGPSADELTALAAEYQLHPLAVQDCLDPEHLPKYEGLGPVSFMILRAYDENAAADADTVHKITRKVALFATCQVEYNDPAVGRATTRVLEKTGVEVTVPPQRCCGIPYLDGGAMDEARALIADNVRRPCAGDATSWRPVPPAAT